MRGCRRRMSDAARKGAADGAKRPADPFRQPRQGFRWDSDRAPMGFRWGSGGRRVEAGWGFGAPGPEFGGTADGRNAGTADGREAGTPGKILMRAGIFAFAFSYLCSRNKNCKDGNGKRVSNRGEQPLRGVVALQRGTHVRLFRPAGNRIGFTTAESRVADVGSNLTTPPSGITPDRRAVLEAPVCDHLLLYIYIIPHTLPASNDIEATKPFPLDLLIECNGKRLLKERRTINQWSGASIELKVSAAGVE